MQINIDFNKEDLVEYIIQHLRQHFALEPVESKFKIGEEAIDILARYRRSRDLVVFLVLKDAANVEYLRRLVIQRELIARYLLSKIEVILHERKKADPEIARNLLNAANGVEGIIIARSYADIMMDELSMYPWLQCYTYDFSPQINQTSSSDLSVKMNYVFSALPLNNYSQSGANREIPENEVINQYIKQNFIHYR